MSNRGLSRIRFSDDQFFHLPFQGSVYGMTRISGIVGENDKIVVISSANRKVYAIDYNRSRRGVKQPSIREVPFTYLPADCEVVAVEAFNKSTTSNEFVVALTFIRVPDEREAAKAQECPDDQVRRKEQFDSSVERTVLMKNSLMSGAYFTSQDVKTNCFIFDSLLIKPFLWLNKTILFRKDFYVRHSFNNPQTMDYRLQMQMCNN
jgi:hypothetical protein